jgi:hypothetical protein
MTLGPWQRRAPLAGAAFVVLIVVGFLIAGSSPDSSDSNQKIVDYLTKDSNQTKNIVAFFLLLVAMLFLITFIAALRDRLVLAAGDGLHSSLAYGAGLVSSAFLFLAIAIFISPIILADDASKIPVDPSTYRITQDLGYIVWVASTVIGALVIWATSAAALATGILPRWFAWFGVVAGIVCLFGVFFFPIFVYWLWILIASILLLRSPVTAPAAALK